MARQRMVKLLAVAVVVGLAGCGDDTTPKTPKLSGPAADKYDMNAKPTGRKMGGGAAAGGGGAGGAAMKN